MRTLLTVPIATALICAPLAAQPGNAPLAWGPAPAVFPAGARMAVVSGDPGKAGMFTVQLSMPDGYRIPPHYHPSDEHVVVRQGTLMVGMGEVLDPAMAKAMAPGDSGTLPARKPHFAFTRGETVISVSAMGPFGMTYVNPADDPQKPKPIGY